MKQVYPIIVKMNINDMEVNYEKVICSYFRSLAFPYRLQQCR